MSFSEGHSVPIHNRFNVCFNTGLVYSIACVCLKPFLLRHGQFLIITLQMLCFHLRAKIEREYGESLLRLAKNTSGKDEIG